MRIAPKSAILRAKNQQNIPYLPCVQRGYPSPHLIPFGASIYNIELWQYNRRKPV